MSRTRDMTKGNITKQMLMFSLPLLNGDSTIDITSALESGSYLNMTVKALADFGVRISRTDEHTIFIKGNQVYKSRELEVEGDCSNAAFLQALDFIGGKVTVEGISENTLQGDRVYNKIFASLENGIREFDLSDCPDLAPILFAVSAVKGGAAFTGTARLKIKESDRSEAMAQELKKLGIEVEVGENHVRIGSSPLKSPTEALCGHNDHRIVMALAVLCTLVGGEIEGAEAVAKSYPDFFEVIKKLKIGLEIYEDR